MKIVCSSSTEITSPRYSNNKSHLDINKKQTKKDTTTNQVGKGRAKSPVGIVCYNFTNLFPEAKEDSKGTWKFIAWATKTYGADLCLSKLEYMREYKKLHKVENPHGLLRVALARDYQPPRYIAGMVKARRKADLAVEHGKKLIEEREEWKAEAVDWNTGAMALSNIINMLGKKEREDGEDY